MAITYLVALPFVQEKDGMLVAGQAGMPERKARDRRAEAMAAGPAQVGALAFKCSGERGQDQFGDATVLMTSSIAAKHLDEF